MNTPQTPQLSSPTLQQRLELARWIELRDELARVHAQLEYVRLMLKMHR
jgi:hypothetical protein